MSDAQAFETALRQNPDDLAGWCAYADWLVEQGDPRGEFMQTQIALEDESRPKSERDELKKKEAALLKKHRKAWLGPLAKAGDEDHEYEPTFARGWLSRLSFSNMTVDQARALAACPSARLLRALELWSCEFEAPTGVQVYTNVHFKPGPDVPDTGEVLEAPALLALAHCPHLDALRTFRLGEGGTGLNGDEEPEHYGGAYGTPAHHAIAKMPNLEELYLLAYNVSAAEVFRLPMPNLRVFQYYFGAAYPLELLAENPSLTNLTTLLCRPIGMRTGDEHLGARIKLPQLRAVCRSPYLKNLQHLRLWLSDFGDEGVEEIIKSGLLKRLKTLDLSRGSVTDDGARALAASPDAKNLEHLNLSWNAIGSDGVKALKAAKLKCDVSEQHTMDTTVFGAAFVPDYLFYGDSE